MPRRPAALIGFLAAVYIAARLWRLTEPCLWFDEIFGVHAAEHTWGGLIEFVAKDLIHPPLFYTLLKLWIAAGGDSLLWLRVFPILFAVLALFPLWMLCRELKLRPAAATAAFGLFAVNGALIKYAQEVRMYSLLLFLSLVSVWLFSRFFFRGKSFWMLVLVNVLLVYSHYFGWFVVASEVAAIAIAQRIKILQTLLMLGVVAAAFVPWILAIIRFAEPGSTVEQNIGWMQRPGLRSLIDLALDLAEPFYFQQSSADPTANLLIAVPILGVVAVAAAVYLFRFKREENMERILFLTVLIVVPLVLAFALSWMLPVSIWGSRHLLIVFAPAILLAAVLLTEVSPKRVSQALIAGTVLLCFAGLIFQLRTPHKSQIWCSWESLASDWAAAPSGSSRPARLYVFEDLVAYHYWFATRHLPNREVVLVKGVEGMPNDPAYFLPRGFEGVLVGDISGIGGDELWLSFRQPSRSEPVGEHQRSTRQFEVPVTNLENLGYQVADVRKQVVGSETAYLVQMKKASTPGSRP